MGLKYFYQWFVSRDDSTFNSDTFLYHFICNASSSYNRSPDTFNIYSTSQYRLSGEWNACSFLCFAQNTNRGMLGRLAKFIAVKADVSSWLQLIESTDHQAVVRHAATPLPDCRCDVKLHEALGAQRMDRDWVPVLRFYLCISAVQGQPWRGPELAGVALSASGLTFHPIFFHQVSIHVAGNERGLVDGMGTSLVRVLIIQVHLCWFDVGQGTGSWKILKLHQGSLVGIVRVLGYQKVYQIIEVGCRTFQCHIFHHLERVKFSRSSVVDCHTMRNRS